MSRYRLFLPMLLVGWLAVSRVQAAPEVLAWYFSGEATTSAQAEALDDPWRAAATTNGATTFSTTSFATGVTGDPVSTFLVGTIPVTATLHQLTDAQVDSAALDTGTLVTPATNGLTLGGTGVMQDGSPKPTSLSTTRHVNEIATITGGAASGRNAILFQFGAPGVMAFGAWFGDVETNPAGRSAMAKVRQANGSVSSLTLAPGISLGNSVTHWLGFVLTPGDSPVTHLLVIVGDDTAGGNGQAEHLSFIGPTIADVPLAVSLAGFSATPQGAQLRVAWETTSELGNLGFNLRRATTPDAPETYLNGALIPAQAPGSGAGFQYEWLDRDIAPDTTYFYWLEDVDASGRVTLHGPVQATTSAPTALTLAALAARPDAAWPALPLTGLIVLGAALWRRCLPTWSRSDG